MLACCSILAHQAAWAAYYQQVYAQAQQAQAGQQGGKEGSGKQFRSAGLYVEIWI